MNYSIQAGVHAFVVAIQVWLSVGFCLSPVTVVQVGRPRNAEVDRRRFIATRVEVFLSFWDRARLLLGWRLVLTTRSYFEQPHGAPEDEAAAHAVERLTGSSPFDLVARESDTAVALRPTTRRTRRLLHRQFDVAATQQEGTRCRS